MEKLLTYIMLLKIIFLIRFQKTIIYFVKPIITICF